MLFDRTTIATVDGRVNAVERFDRGPVQAVTLVLQTTDGDLTVLLGPSWYLDQQSVKLAKGDVVEVAGSRVVFDGKPMIVAQIVKRAGDTITLRDATGQPAWAGPSGGGPASGSGPMGRGPVR